MNSGRGAEHPGLTLGGEKTEYIPSWLAALFHSFPHISLKFRLSNSTFNLDDEEYIQSLGFAAALPVLLLLLVLFIFSIYCCCRCSSCCNKNAASPRRKNTPCLKWTIAIITLLTCGVLASGLFGNEKFNKGVLQVRLAGSSAAETIDSANDVVGDMGTTINNSIVVGVNGFDALFKKSPVPNATIGLMLDKDLQAMVQQGRNIMKYASEIHKDADTSQIRKILEDIKQYEGYRWLATIVVLSFELLICLLLLIAVMTESKALLMVCTAFVVFNLIISWLTAGVYLGVSVGAGDLCVDPDQFVSEEAKKSGFVDQAVVHYYITNCTSLSDNPFRDDLQSASASVSKINSSLTDIVWLASPFFEQYQIDQYSNPIRQDLKKLVGDLENLQSMVDCTPIHNDYVSALKGMCYKGLDGLAFMLLSAAVTGFLLAFVIVFNSRAWRHWGKRLKRKGRYSSIDEDDPFLPNIDQDSDQTPVKYYRSRGPYTNIEEDDPFLPRLGPEQSRPTSPLLTEQTPSGQLRRERLVLQNRDQGSPPPAYEYYADHGRSRYATGTASPTDV
ncbi:protein tweety homolog 1-B isoform X2 [Lingula anatina]|uniref:Protein tweety homolog n=1 Tax=Lingula anatina TaxID=7574 RepID=A0A1S3IDI1_LINAN|nr:protein tweety homolog 1-B isoform X2 [Lingula anatina]|eukprot:XP_013395494.1 protein tweety homolog 1-B isoform X2 [Lingula anatina]